MPLFSFVWEYNNQPIQVLAADIAALSVNTQDYVPVSDGTAFIDSPLKAIKITPTVTLLVSEYNGTWDGIKISPAKYEFGAISAGAGAGYNTKMEVADLGASAWFSTTYPVFSQLGLDGPDQAILATNLDDTTAGGSSGKFLRVKIGNTLYKLDLLNS